MNDGIAGGHPLSLNRLYIVRRNAKYGFIDQTGKEVIPCKYDGASNFSEGLAAVSLEDGWGYMMQVPVSTPSAFATRREC